MPLNFILTHFNMLHLMSLIFLLHDNIFTYIRINKKYISTCRPASMCFCSLLRRNMISVNVYKNVAFFHLICIFPENFSEYIYIY